MWKFTLRVTMYIKKFKCFRAPDVILQVQICSWARGMPMVTYNLCVTIFEIKVFTQSINK